MNTLKTVLFICIAFSLSACTWVQLTEEGEKVRILSSAEVASCKKVGQTTSTTKATMAGVKRHPNAIADELDSLARNSAINLNGDTIVPSGEIQDGKQSYQVYRCVPQ